MNSHNLKIATFMLTWIGLTPQLVSAATFTVNSTIDSIDINPGDGICETIVANECTLRAAIQESNALLGGDTIELPNGEYVLSIVGYGGAEDGDLDLTDELSIIGQSMEDTIIDGGEMEDGIFHIYGSVSANIQGLTVQNCDGLFAGIWNEGSMSLESVIVKGNRRGINSTTFASATINSSIIEQNNPRGGIENFGVMSIQNSVISDNTEDWGGYGGGIKNLGTMLLDSTTINNNYAGRGGGGIHNRDELSVINSTISGNRTDDIYQIGIGGGIYNISFWPTLLYNVTIANNESTRASGIFISATSADTSLKNTVIADNVGGVNCEVFGSLTSQGYNLSDDSTCNLTNIGDITNTDPLLGALENNGGLNPTHSLLENSPAIDAGQANCTDLNGLPLLIDQRGESRPVDGNDDGLVACDIGAFEVQPLTTIIVAIDIIPKRDVNSINLNNKGSIKVAILSTAEFSAYNEVNPDSIAFGPAGAVATRYKVKDINGDGLHDIVFYFKISETGIECGDTEATLVGETYDGETLEGTDSIVTKGCGQ